MFEANAPSCIVENQDVSCFSLLTEEELETVRQNEIWINYKKGENITKQGSFASHIVFLEKGLVKVFLEGNPKDLILKIIPSQHLIGLPSIYDGNNTFLYSTQAYIESEVRLIDINTFKNLIRSNAQFAAKVINILNENTAQIYGRFYCLMRKQSHGRVADILLCLSQRVYKRKDFVLELTRSDLADLTGLSAESVSRILKDFVNDGIIKVSGKKFEMLNFDKLEKISRTG
ncbi:MAG: Crp/Fnr family transcriptional regulator [Bacteroidales bacterium]|nr:Crp/Fnr family transcriptional regulator [Bacteroidales bacterium]